MNLSVKSKKPRCRRNMGISKRLNGVRRFVLIVMHPYSMVKDHRTEQETGNVERVMDGGIDEFIEAYLKWNPSKED